jgi:type I site-specific restriction-modification system R (restriction) subunit
MDCFVNGLPLVVIELEKPDVPPRAAFDERACPV